MPQAAAQPWPCGVAMTRSGAAQGGDAAGSCAALHVDAAWAEDLSGTLPASLAHVVREIGWLLVRRAQLVKEGRPAAECLHLLHPLAQACRTYYDSLAQLRDQLLVAEAVLEHVLDGREPAGEPITSTPLAPIDLYSVMSTLPSMPWGQTTTEIETPRAPSLPAPAMAIDSIDAALAHALPLDPVQPPPSGASVTDAIAIDSDDSDSATQEAPAATLPTSAAPSAEGRHDPPSGDELVTALLTTPLPPTNDAPAPPDSNSAPAALSEQNADVAGSVPGAEALSDASALDFSWLDLDGLGGGDVLGLGQEASETNGLAGLDFGTLQDLT
ncbi:hypothetical protein MNAN1_001749 [Malassezia nana]|uniref:Uncharacterized protein n=1 Tax=Malassezia nana TaxID=180528 RepID=A0AAF0ER51_9BASI|nr:hypothetical protein MNAN1_001749 [Malassezia nana]